MKIFFLWSVLLVCIVIQVETEAVSHPLFSNEFRIHLSSSFSGDFGKHDPVHALSLIEKKRVLGLPQHKRNPELSLNHIVVVAFNEEEQEVARQILLDPRLVRHEDFDPLSGEINSSSAIRKEDAELRVVIPDDLEVAMLELHSVKWEGTRFYLESMGKIETSVGEQIIHPKVTVPFVTIRDNGDPANRIDLTILGDGYVLDELSQYHFDVEKAVNGFFNQEPFKEYQKYFNVHRLDVISNESGADHPEKSPPQYRDTALNSTYNCGGIERLLCISVNKVNNILDGSVPNPNQRDIILVIVNDSKYGGSGGSVAVTSVHSSMVELVLHELGHSFGLLADEYEYGNCSNQIEPSQPNVTKEIDRALIKWNVGGGPPLGWIDIETPVPTFHNILGIPGLYEGAKYCASGLYRPTYNSKMRNLGKPFEQINEEQLVKRIYNWVSPIDSLLPPDFDVVVSQGETQIFEVQVPTLLTDSLNIEWKLNGVPQSNSSKFILDSTGLNLGDHVVEVTVSDLTARVRNDPNSILKEVSSWVVKIVTPGIDYWIEDTPLGINELPDTGEEPNTVTQVIWSSRGIWVRNNRVDSGPNQPKHHENPEYGQENVVYALIQNRGNVTTSDAKLTVYYSHSSSGLVASPPELMTFTKIGTVSVPEISPGGHTTIGLSWYPPEPLPGASGGHFCLLGVVESLEDPTIIPSGKVGVSQYVRHSNNAVQKNVLIVDELPDGSKAPLSFIMRNIYDEEVVMRLLLRFANAKGKLLPLPFELVLKDFKQLLPYIENIQGGELKEDDLSKEVMFIMPAGEKQAIIDARMKAGEEFFIEVIINNLIREIRCNNRLDIMQLLLEGEEEELVGGITIGECFKVDLISFQGVSKRNGVHLIWKTGTEKENAGFYIWRANSLTQKCDLDNLVNIQKIAFVPTIYDDSLGGDYSYVDKVSVKGTYCYALEDVDYNGNGLKHLGNKIVKVIVR